MFHPRFFLILTQVGLYDGYRDYIFNIYDGARAHSPKIKLLLGPFEHSEAYNSAFTPSYEDRCAEFESEVNDAVV